MVVLTSDTGLTLWREMIKYGEERCEIRLEAELEAYLVSLLMRYINKPEMAEQVFAEAFLEAMRIDSLKRNFLLQQVGDQCLLFAGLFPHRAEKKRVKINYFVDLGQSAYAAISHTANDIYGLLAMEFVLLMDVLQSIGPHHLLPLEAYEQWNLVGSKRALRALQLYTQAIPIKRKV